MPKIIVKTKDPTHLPLLSRHKKPGYDLVGISPEVIFDAQMLQEKDIHGIIVDSDLITPGQIEKIKEWKKEDLFPVILLSDKMSEEEAGQWIACGVSDIFQLPIPSALIGKRIGAAVQLYCVTQSLHGQVKDQLTGLFNRQAFYHFAKEMMLRGPEDDYVVILSDISNFKRINERFGEEKGDALLHFVGKMLKSMNNENVLFARYGGDQFVGILRRPKVPMEIDEGFLQQSMARFYREAPVDQFSVQFGIYEDVDKTLPVSIMCDRARMALNTIKHQYGQPFARYSAPLQQKFNREQQILDSMEEAIFKHQIEVYYQPKHHAATSDVIGAEALVRWNHPVFGFLSPREFIPLFERSGFIGRMDEYVWRQVCEDLKQMKEKALPVVPISVNVSRQTVISEQFLHTIETVLEEEHLDPKLLHMELTETVYMEDAKLLAPLMERIKTLGIRIELDDFGSGYSSLGILSGLPVDIVKLDISLIRNMEKQPAIVKSLVELMHKLGYSVIAEGAETEKQVSMLKKMECDAIQGYYYSKPLTLSGFCNYIAFPYR